MFSTLRYRVKQITEAILPSRSILRLGQFIGETLLNFESRAKPRGNSIVIACVNWIARTFPEAPIQVMQRAEDGDQPVEQHPLTALLRRPNPFYSGVLLWMATLSDWTIDGNAYWLKVRSGAGQVVQLWWLPQALVEPQFPRDGRVFISHYEYKPGNDVIRLEADDVVHFRYGLDPENMRKGLSPMKSLVREIVTDDSAANWTAAMLRNFAVPGIVISPKDANSTMTPATKESIRKQLRERAGGDMKGAELVLDGGVVADIISFSPQQMELANIRDIPEERITAVLGIPAAVVGLGSGLQQTKVGATMRELREQAVENNIIPTQRLFAEDIETQLLPDFSDPARFGIAFDVSQIRALQQDQNAMWERVGMAWERALLTRNQALAQMGLPDAGPDGDVFRLPFNIILEGAKDAAHLWREYKQEPGTVLVAENAPDDDQRRALEKETEQELEDYMAGLRRRLIDELRAQGLELRNGRPTS